ncbi:DUF2905 domain-containing protein [Desulfogranum marinum]|uniref:DUF2905 domain-containing protein n=1 Tax=Desulfogranum marinum TaxID=453220 RepID=UPI001963672F|nr:DUF2905 domain-containing protein [Desulfogranum marinum]MBM9511476.1 DUF2905 domain-containing protein [Desulfogranum marinum]
MNKALIWVGVICICIGACWPWIKQIPFGRFPGDIIIVRENFRFYFPVTTCLLFSVIISVLIWFFRK